MSKNDFKVIVRGAGDLATGVIHRLVSAGFKVLVLECPKPSAIRRQVSLCEAVYQGEQYVEGLGCKLIKIIADCEETWAAGKVPLLVDATGACIKEFQPNVVVDAIIAKVNLGTTMDMASMTIALGPGFVAGEDVHAVVETKRGHNLGRIIRSGPAAPNSGVPGNIAGYAAERVIHAQIEGKIEVVRDIGDFVEKGEVIARIVNGWQNEAVFASLTGIIRGMIRDGFYVTKGFKIADIDPRKEELNNCFTISDKARCIAGSVLELVCAEYVKTVEQ